MLRRASHRVQADPGTRNWGVTQGPLEWLYRETGLQMESSQVTVCPLGLWPLSWTTAVTEVDKQLLDPYLGCGCHGALGSL